MDCMDYMDYMDCMDGMDHVDCGTPLRGCDRRTSPPFLPFADSAFFAPLR